MRNCSKNYSCIPEACNLVLDCQSFFGACASSDFLSHKIRNQMFKNIMLRDAEGHFATETTLDFCECIFLSLKK